MSFIPFVGVLIEEVPELTFFSSFFLGFFYLVRHIPILGPVLIFISGISILLFEKMNFYIWFYNIDQVVNHNNWYFVFLTIFFILLIYKFSNEMIPTFLNKYISMKPESSFLKKLMRSRYYGSFIDLVGYFYIFIILWSLCAQIEFLSLSLGSPEDVFKMYFVEGQEIPDYDYSFVNLCYDSYFGLVHGMESKYYFFMLMGLYIFPMIISFTLQIIVLFEASLVKKEEKIISISDLYHPNKYRGHVYVYLVHFILICTSFIGFALTWYFIFIIVMHICFSYILDNVIDNAPSFFRDNNQLNKDIHSIITDSIIFFHNISLYCLLGLNCFILIFYPLIYDFSFFAVLVTFISFLVSIFILLNLNIIRLIFNLFGVIHDKDKTKYFFEINQDRIEMLREEYTLKYKDLLAINNINYPISDSLLFYLVMSHNSRYFRYVVGRKDTIMIPSRYKKI